MSRSPAVRPASFARFGVWMLVVVVLLTGLFPPGVAEAAGHGNNLPNTSEENASHDSSDGPLADLNWAERAVVRVGDLAEGIAGAAPSGGQTALTCVAGFLLPGVCLGGLGAWGVGNALDNRIEDGTIPTTRTLSLEPGSDGCYLSWQYDSEKLRLDDKYSPPGCARNLLPAWRWQNSSTELTGYFRLDDFQPQALNLLATIGLTAAGFLWSLLLGALEWALTANLALSAHGLIDTLYVAVAGAVTSSTLFILFIAVIAGGLVRAAFRSDTRKVITTIVMASLMVGLIHAFMDNASESAGNVTQAEFCEQYRNSPSAHSYCMDGNAAADIATPPTGSPGWFAWRGVRLSDTVTIELIEPFTDADSNLQFLGTFADGERTALSCQSYVDGLYDVHATVSGAETGMLMAGMQRKDSEPMLRAASRFWESGYLSYWKMAQFGLSNSVSEPSACRLLEAQANINPGEQFALNYLANGGIVHPEVFEVNLRRGTEASKQIYAWSACTLEPGSGFPSVGDDASDGAFVVPPAFDDKGDCGAWWATGTPPETADVSDSNSPEQIEAQMLDATWTGYNSSERVFAGFFAFIVSIVYLWTFGAMALGALMAQIGIVVMMIFLPVTLLLLALPGGKGAGANPLGRKMLRLTGAMFLSKVMFSVALALTFLLTGLIQALMSATTGGLTGMSTGMLGMIAPLAASGPGSSSGMFHQVMVGLSPLLALFVMRKVFKAIGMGSITSLSGATSFATTAALKSVGEHDAADKVRSAIPSVGKSAAKWGKRAAIGGAAMAAGTGLAAYGAANLTEGGRAISARATGEFRHKVGTLNEYFQKDKGKDLRTTMGALGQTAAMFGSGRSRKFGYHMMGANKLLGEGGVLSMIGTSPDATPGDPIELTPGTQRRLDGVNTPGTEAEPGGTRKGQKVLREFDRAGTDKELEDHAAHLLGESRQATTGRRNPAALDEESREAQKEHTLRSLGLDPERDGEHFIVSSWGEVLAKPGSATLEHFEGIGRPDLANLSYLQAAAGDSAYGTMINDAYGESMHDRDRYAELVALGGLMTGGAQQGGGGQIHHISDPNGHVNHNALDGDLAIKLEHVANTRASARAEHESFYLGRAKEVIQDVEVSGLDVRGPDPQRHQTADQVRVEVAAVQGLLGDLTADLTSPDAATVDGVPHRLEVEVQPRLEAAAGELTKILSSQMTVGGATRALNGDGEAAVRELEATLGAELGGLTTQIEKLLADATTNATANPDVSVQALDSLTRLVSERVSDAEMAHMNALRELDEVKRDVAKRTVVQQHVDNTEAGRKKTVSPSSIRATQEGAKRLAASSGR